MNNKALLIIDLQNDYFEKGKFPLHNTEKTLNNIKELTSKFQQQGIHIIHIHIIHVKVVWVIIHLIHSIHVHVNLII